MSLVWITKASFVENYKISLEFNDSKSGIVDCSNILTLPIYKELKDIEKFKNFKLNSWTLEWENGADFSPEFLYQLI
jgi:hypothetical protein